MTKLIIFLLILGCSSNETSQDNTTPKEEKDSAKEHTSALSKQKISDELKFLGKLETDFNRQFKDKEDIKKVSHQDNTTPKEEKGPAKVDTSQKSEEEQVKVKLIDLKFEEEVIHVKGQDIKTTYSSFKKHTSALSKQKISDELKFLGELEIDFNKQFQEKIVCYKEDVEKISQLIETPLDNLCPGFDNFVQKLNNYSKNIRELYQFFREPVNILDNLDNNEILNKLAFLDDLEVKKYQGYFSTEPEFESIFIKFERELDIYNNILKILHKKYDPQAKEKKIEELKKLKEKLDTNNKGIKEVYSSFKKHLNTLNDNKKILDKLAFLDKDKKISENMKRLNEGEGDAELGNLNNSIAVKKLKEIFYFLSKEEDIEKIGTILENLKNGFSNSNSRTMLEIEASLYEVKTFSNLEKKIDFHINKFRESQLFDASLGQICDRLGESIDLTNPHLVSYVRNIMKDLLKLNEDYQSKDDLDSYNKKLQDNPLDKQDIVNKFNELCTPESLISSIEDYITIEEIERYLGDTNIEVVENGKPKEARELKKDIIEAILIKMGHLSK